MRSELERFVDRQKIHDVLMTYCRGVDRCDAELVQSVYHEDSYDDHGYWKGRGWDFAPFVVDRVRAANSATMHSITNVLIAFDADGRAHSEAHVNVTLVRRGSGPVTADLMGGRYIDRLSERDGVWRIEERTVVLDWTKVEIWPEVEAALPLDTFKWGRRGDRSDPVYTMLERGSLR